MRLDLAFVDLDHRPQCLRLASCFGWLHHPSVLRGLTPPACTNLHCSNSIQMCERNPTLSLRYRWNDLKSPSHALSVGAQALVSDGRCGRHHEPQLPIRICGSIRLSLANSAISD